MATKSRQPAAAPVAAPAGAAAAAEAGRGYTVLARRYRSRSFDELVGQEAVSRTLRQAIEQGRTAHAYLFCGTRGVGKTSMARIFARALNVAGQQQAREIGDAILRGEDMDVIEIDGASNRGIDDARELISAAGLAPARSPYKIYIIDEVHMLTTPAFNALLKTMEEPPPHVKFILCTTEAHKVPATIQSRCQRFDFRAIPTARIAEHLRHVLQEEHLEADEEVILLVARLANGSMRDSLSLLDRLIAAANGRLTRQVAEEVLGLPDEALVAEVVAAMAAQDPAAGLTRAARLLEQGVSVERALDLLAERLRLLMVASVCGPESPLLEVGADARRDAAEQARAFTPESLVAMIALCDGAARTSRGSASPRTIFDAAVVRLCLSARFASIPALLRGEVPEEKKKAADRLSDAAPAAHPAPRAFALPPPSAPTPAAPPSARPSAPTPAPPPAAPASAPPPAGVPDDAGAFWARVAAAATTRREKTVVEALEPLRWGAGRLVVRPRLSVDGAAWIPRPGDLEPIAARAAGRPVIVQVESSEAAAVAPATPLPAEERDAMLRHPAVRAVMDLFDARLVSVTRAVPPAGAEAAEESAAESAGSAAETEEGLDHLVGGGDDPT